MSGRYLFPGYKSIHPQNAIVLARRNAADIIQLDLSTRSGGRKQRCELLGNIDRAFRGYRFYAGGSADMLAQEGQLLDDRIVKAPGDRSNMASQS